MRTIKIGKDLFFVINSETGKWGIGNNNSRNALEEKLIGSKLNKIYKGTSLCDYLLLLLVILANNTSF
jgi:hypothetical protein